jgi:archaetidylinositol phosphate synthase
MTPDSTLLTAAAQRPWDARLARRLVTPLKDSRATPNHLTTIRLAVGLAAAAAFLPGSYGWTNFGALLMVLSNFLDHTDGELARISGKTSRIGHLYDLASDALVTILLFLALGIGVGTHVGSLLQLPPALLGLMAGSAVALIFYLRMKIESRVGKSGTQQGSLGGFETEDILYLMPLVTLCNGLTNFLIAAAIGAPLFAIWVTFDYWRVTRRLLHPAGQQTSEVA